MKTTKEIRDILSVCTHFDPHIHTSLRLEKGLKLLCELKIFRPFMRAGYYFYSISHL